MTNEEGGTRGAWMIMAGGWASLLAVAAGAFGRHFLESRLDEHALQIFDTGARYQMYHGLALLLVAALAPRLSGSNVTLIGRLFVAGIIIFSGSLYALALSGVKMLGAITPLGGICFWMGWILLVRAGRRMLA